MTGPYLNRQCIRAKNAHHSTKGARHNATFGFCLHLFVSNLLYECIELHIRSADAIVFDIPAELSAQVSLTNELVLG